MNARASVLVVAGLLVLAASCGSASASSTLTVPAQPQGERTDGATVWFQGYLADSVTGDPLTGSYNVVAAIYTLESGGAPVWGPETHNGTQVLEGWFHIELGSIVTPFLSFAVPPYYLQLTVNGEVMSPRQKLASVPSAMRLSGTARVTAFEMPTDAAAGRVLMSDASGNGTWQAAPGTIGGAGTAGYIPKFTGATTIGDSALRESAGNIYLDDGTILSGSMSGDPAGDFTSYYQSSDAVAVRGLYGGGGQHDAVAVYGRSYPADYYGIGGRFEGGWRGVEGDVSTGGAGTYTGVHGNAEGGSGTNYGVVGSASGSGTNYGVYGSASGGTPYAGYFAGAVHATGGFTSGKAGMKIDDPLDPANRYLSHSFVGSSEMMNVYSGNVALDGAGAARVELPDWFEALNQDFRYQLTCIGAFAPVYVAEKIGGGSFSIAGGTPGMEVSWQVTAIRRDPVALEERQDVVQEKPGREAGKYLDPEAYGMPASAGVGYVEEKEGGR